MLPRKCATLILIALSFHETVQFNSQDDQIKFPQECTAFSSIMKKARSLIERESSYHCILEQIGFVKRLSIFGADICYKFEYVEAIVKSAKALTIAAQIFKSDFKMPLNDFESLARKCLNAEISPNLVRFGKHPKYRSIDGSGNNLKHPEWGASLTPFTRFGGKNYEDGIYEVKKSVTGVDLPNARLLVQELMLKAVRSPPPEKKFNVMALLLILFVTHDLHYQVPMQTQNCRKAQINCCSKDNSDVLPPSLANSACLPIQISNDDPFYKRGNVGCLNMVRSQIGKYKSGVEVGEILNHATAYMDLSLIYGNHEFEMAQVRRYEGGELRMGRNNVLPVDSNGKYLPSMNRFVSVPIASIYPALFARNHNHLARRLADLNRHWCDEKIFQEARRINIANFQFNLITAKSIERVFHAKINESYSDERNAGTSLEFAFAYRGGHHYTPSHMLFLSENYTETKHLQSDTIWKIKLLEDDFDDALRGAINQQPNVLHFSDEIINRIEKDSNGYGVDLIATDIQRCRDHGLPSFVEMRRKCKLTPEINSFDDFNKIFNKTNVDLLKNIYKSHEDVDFYVGGLLEGFQEGRLAGNTFGCVVGENYKNVMGGDIYYYTHPENPYPFKKAQIDAIHSYTFSHIYCTNSKMKQTNKLWSYTSHSTNPKIDCKNFAPMDLSAWKERIIKSNL